MLPLDELPADLDELVLIQAKAVLGYDFCIGKYPVTNYQFRRFIEADGYTDERWWQEKKWRQARDQWKWQQLRIRTDPKFNQPAQPVVGVSWYEANAYCGWLTAQLQVSGIIICNEQVRLPTQEEWMVAARSGCPAPANASEDYPWRGPFDPTRTNTDESDIGQTMPVHKYPCGRTADGVWDMSGNVWEWTNDRDKDGFPYLKGGSWWDDESQATAAASGWAGPDDWSVNIGFRCVVVPIPR